MLHSCNFYFNDSVGAWYPLSSCLKLVWKSRLVKLIWKYQTKGFQTRVGHLQNITMQLSEWIKICELIWQWWSGYHSSSFELWHCMQPLKISGGNYLRFVHSLLEVKWIKIWWLAKRKNILTIDFSFSRNIFLACK